MNENRDIEILGADIAVVRGMIACRQLYLHAKRSIAFLEEPEFLLGDSFEGLQKKGLVSGTDCSRGGQLAAERLARRARTADDEAPFFQYPVTSHRFDLNRKKVLNTVNPPAS